MYALINVCYLKRNKQLFICSSDSFLALITLISLISLTLSETHVVFHDMRFFLFNDHFLIITFFNKIKTSYH